MKKFTTIFLLLFSSVSFAQTLNMDAFSTKFDVIKEKLSLPELRQKQKGFIFSFNFSAFGNTIPNSYDFKIMYIKENIFPFGIYVGSGATETFVNSVPIFNDFSSDFIYIPFTYEELNQFGYDDDDFHIHNYGSLGFTKNITIKSTVYIGYSRILGIDRDIQVYPLNRWEEQDMVDIGYIYLTRKVSFITGLSFHLPYYNNETPSSANYTSFEKINIRPQLGVGFNL